MSSRPLLAVRDLTVRLRSSKAAVLDRISFTLGEGESVGLLGKSGCGKTTLARTLTRLLPARDWETNGSVQFQGTEILDAGKRRLEAIRGCQLSLISQEPELALHPVLTVGKQIDEVLRAHSKLDRPSRRTEIELMLGAAGLPASRTFSAYPHELSGGERQRVAIAQSLITKPALVIADEPTSALDSATEREVLAILKRLKERFQLALLFITHNPALLDGLADRFLTIDSGRLVREANFIEAAPDAAGFYASHFAQTPSTRSDPQDSASQSDEGPLLAIRNLRKTFVAGGGPLRKPSRVEALADIQLEIAPRSTLALLGPSGSGKSTLGRCVALLEKPDTGSIHFLGRDVLALRGADLAAMRRRVQLVFQHSATALNPRFSALDAVAEPLRIGATASERECRERATAMMDEVGISPQWIHRSTLEFSGGQRQRIALARALALRPQLIVLDEALAGLDPAMQGQIVQLLLRLQGAFAVSYLFISHDLRMAAQLADAVAVIERGRIVETGSTAEILHRAEGAAFVPFHLPATDAGQARPDTVL